MIIISKDIPSIKKKLVTTLFYNLKKLTQNKTISIKQILSEFKNNKNSCYLENNTCVVYF